MKGPGEVVSSLSKWARKFALDLYQVPYLHGPLATINHTVRGFVSDDCHIMAAAISFYAVLSLIPFMLLMLSLSGYVLEYLGQGHGGQETLFLQLADYVKAVFPFATQDFIDRLHSITVNREAFGVTGLVVLVVTSGLVFRSLELAFARVFHTSRHRSLVAHQLLFVVFLLALGLVFLSVHYITVIGTSVVSGRHGDFASAINDAMQRYLLARITVTIITGTVVFYILLKYFSNHKIRNRASLFAGFMFSILWMLASKIFGYYLEGLARFSLLYGSLATPAVIIVWIFYSAIILLLCTELARVMQERYWPIDGKNTKVKET